MKGIICSLVGHKIEMWSRSPTPLLPELLVGLCRRCGKRIFEMDKTA